MSPTIQRPQLRVCLLLSIVALLVMTGGTAAITANQSILVNTDNGTAAEPGTGSPVPYENETITTAYVDPDSSSLMLLTSGNHTIDLNVSAEVIGRGANLDDDWYAEIPYVKDNGELYAIDRTGEKTQLADNAQSSTTALVATEFEGERVVIYENSNGEIQKVPYNGSPQQITDGGIQGNAVLGVGDLTGDDVDELLYLGTSNGQFYYNSTMESGKQFAGFSLGSDSGGIGVGAPRDFDNDDKVEVPLVESSPNLYYVGDDGKVDISVTPGKYPVGSRDVVGNSTPELLYVDESEPLQIQYVTADGSKSGYLTDADGNRLNTTPSAGVAYVNGSEEPLNVANLTLVNESGTLRGAFNSTVALSQIDAEITGPDGRDLTRSNFTETQVGTDYRYTTDYKPTRDGNYTLTLTAVEDEDGDTAEPNLTADATIDMRFDIYGLNVTATPTQNLTINLSADEPVDSLDVTVSGAETIQLDRSNFSAQGSNPPYTYTTTVNTDSYGEYNVTFERGESEDGQIDEETMEDSVTIEEPLRVSDLTLTNKSGVLTTSFNSSKELDGVNLDVSGPDAHSFSISNLSQSSSAGDYTYTGNYTPNSDGNYTANLTSATSDSDSVNPDLTANATVDVRFNITDLRTNTTPDRELGVTFNATEPLDSVMVNISGAETATLGLSNFTTGDSSTPYTYSGSYDRTAEGTYNVTLVRGQSTDGQVDTPGLKASEQINESLELWNLTLSNQNGTLETTFQATERLDAVDADVDGPDSRSFSVTDFSEVGSNGNYTYTTNYTPDADGNYTAAVTFGRSTDGSTDNPTLTDNATINERFNVTNLSATATQGGPLSVTFNATNPVDTVRIEVSGAENTTLGMDSFTLQDSDTAYVYNGSYSASTPGEYTVTFWEAQSTNGHVDDDPLTANATIEDPLRVWNFTLSNTTNTRNLTASFHTNKPLTHTAVDIRGPQDYDLTRGNFTESSNSNNYTYTTEFPTTAGTYNSTLRSVSSNDGETATPGYTDTAVISGPFDVYALDATPSPNRTARINLTATAPLAELSVSVSGAEDATLSLDRFSTNDTTAPYTYTGTYDATTTGTYDVIFNRGESRDGNVDDDQITDSVVFHESLHVWNLTLTEENGTLTTQFAASKQLTGINTVVDGPDDHTFTRNEFTEASDDGSYRYTANYTPDSDGDYTATLASVTAHTDTSRSPGLTANETVNVRHPHVNATLLDQTDHNGIVNESDHVTIIANVSGDVDGVELTRTPFSNETSTLNSVSNGVYTANTTVGDLMSGEYTVQVRAFDSEQSDVTDESTPITVDTAPPITNISVPSTTTPESPTQLTAVTVADEETRVTDTVWKVNGEPIANSSANTTADIANESYTFDNVGTQTVTLLAVDAAGNWNNDTETVVVTDSEPEQTTTGQANNPSPPPASPPTTTDTHTTTVAQTSTGVNHTSTATTTHSEPTSTPSQTTAATQTTIDNQTAVAPRHNVEMPFGDLFGVTGATTLLALAAGLLLTIRSRRRN